jgi:hypothetical protein
MSVLNYLCEESLQLTAGMQLLPAVCRPLLKQTPTGHDDALLLCDVGCVLPRVQSLQSRCVFHQYLSHDDDGDFKFQNKPLHKKHCTEAFAIIPAAVLRGPPSHFQSPHVGESEPEQN